MKFRKNLLVIFTFLFCLGMVQTYQFNACDSVAACDEELSQIENDIKETEQKIADSKASEKSLREQIEVYNQNIQLTNQQIATLEETIAVLENDIKEKEIEIAKKDKIILEQLKVQQKQKNNSSFFNLLFSSDSLSDFMQRLSVVETLSSKEKVILDELAQAKAELEIDRQKQEEQKVTLEQTKQDLVAAKAEKERLMIKVQDELAEQEAALNAYSATADEIEAQRDILNRPPPPGGSGGGGSTPSNGAWHLPVDAGAVVTTHYLQMYEYSSSPHLGTDIAAYRNAPIYSMADGYVLAAGSYGMFGNLVAVGHIIDGTYYVSMYGHMNYLNVSTGQYVYGGSTVLGGMGNTGYSFGTHVHVELAYRDYFTVNKPTRSATNTDALGKLNWRGAYADWSWM